MLYYCFRRAVYVRAENIQWLQLVRCRNKLQLCSVAAPEIFVWRAVSQRVWGTEVPSGVQGRSPGREFGDFA